MPNSQHKKIGGLSEARNFNSSEYLLSDLKGDSFDYVIEGTAVGGLLGIELGGDGTSNYRGYYMRGLSSTASTLVNDATIVNDVIGSTDTDKPSAFRLIVTGDSSTERFINGLASVTGGVYVRAIYWKNTAVELDSIGLFDTVSRTTTVDFRIHQIPKQSNLNNGNLIEILEWSAESGTKSFTGLKGDTDEEYEIVWESTGSAGVSTNLTGSIYKEQDLKNSGGSINASNSTSTTYIDGLYQNGTLNLKAQSGRSRLFTGSTAKITSSQQAETECWILDDANEVNQINIIPSGSITATAKLYKRKSNKTIDPVPMETLVEYDIDGDFSAGITLSNLELDRLNGPIKIEYIGEGPTQLRMRVNGDSGSNYSNQRLAGIQSSPFAQASTLSFFYLCEDGSTTNSSSMWLYPKSGQNRPSLNKYIAQEDRIDFRAQWWSNIANEINLIDIFASTSSVITGTIRVSVPEGTKMATPSATLTIN